MGSISDAVLRYGRPVLDATDGSHEQMAQAIKLIQLYWNVAMQPQHEREAELVKQLGQLDIPEEDWGAVREQVASMVERHQAMFPGMHQGEGIGELLGGGRRPREKYPGARRTRPCPCGSGKKYKHCCLVAPA